MSHSNKIVADVENGNGYTYNENKVQTNHVRKILREFTRPG